jgi:hypothetical protein
MFTREISREVIRAVGRRLPPMDTKPHESGRPDDFEKSIKQLPAVKSRPKKKGGRK